MAKGNRNYVMSGKVGNSVLYKLTDSNNKDIQGERTYVAKIANPKTVAQCIQRVKMDPAVRFYRAFKEEILDHSFEGVKYGGKSHNRFSKLALMMKNGFPYCTKDENVLAPGNYVMAEGSINSINITNVSITVIKANGLAVGNAANFGAYSAAILSSLPFLKDGDQITFAFIVGDDLNSTFAFVHRIVLDTTSTDTIDSKLGSIQINATGEISVHANDSDLQIFGSAIIVSRPERSKTNGSITWLRSTTKMAINTKNEFLIAKWFSQDSYQKAVSSYMSSESQVSSDWYLNQGKLDKVEANIPEQPSVLPAAMTYRQCLNETARAYGHYYAAILDPRDGKTKVIADNFASDSDFAAFYYGEPNDSIDTAPGEVTKVTRLFETETDPQETPNFNIEWYFNEGLQAGDPKRFDFISWDEAIALANSLDISCEFEPGEEPG